MYIEIEKDINQATLYANDDEIQIALIKAIYSLGELPETFSAEDDEFIDELMPYIKKVW